MTAGDAAWESMSMRQLRSECKLRHIDVSGCFERPDFISQLQAAAASTAEGADTTVQTSEASSSSAKLDTAVAADERPDAAGLHSRATSSRGGCNPDDAVGSSRVGGADAWHGMSVRELRREAAQLSVDLAGCHDKSEMIERLRLAAEASAAGDTRCTDDRGGTAEAGVEEESKVPSAARAGTTSPQGNEAGVSTGKPLESMSVRELRQECYRRGIGVTGCYDKGSFISRLQAVAPDAGDAPTEARPPIHEMHHASVGPSVPDASQGPSNGQEVPSGHPLSCEEADLTKMSMRELRKLCELHGIDFSTCFDKAEVVRKLRSAAGKDASSMGQPADRAANPLGEADTLGAQRAESEAVPDAAAGMPQGHGLRTVSHDGGTLPSSIPIESGPGSFGAAPLSGTHVKPCGAEGSSTQQGSGGAVADSHGATPQSGAAGSHLSRLDKGTPLEAVPMRQLKQECVALGIDITGCYAKSEIINRLRAHASSGDSQRVSGGAGHATGAFSHQEADGPVIADKCRSHDKAGSEVPLAASPGAAEESECQRLEGMSMRQLKRECEDQGISHAGCYSKCEIIRLLQANSSSAGGKPRQRQQIANPNEPDVQEIADPLTAVSRAESWHAMSLSELRIECELHGVDLQRCSNRDDLVRQLEASRQGRRSRVHLADKASQSESEPLAMNSGQDEARHLAGTRAAGGAAQQPLAGRPHTSDAEKRDSLPQPSQLPDRSSDSGAGVGAEPSRSREVSLHSGRLVELNAASIGKLSAHELRQECDAHDLDLDGCLDKADVVERLLAALEAWAADNADKQGNNMALGQKTSVEQPPKEDHRPKAGVERDGVRAAREEPAPGEAIAAGSVGLITGGNAWETYSMRQLKSECKARGIDVTGCFDKASVIVRLRAASKQAGLQGHGVAPTAQATAATQAAPASRARLSIADLYKLTVEELRQKCIEEGMAADSQEPKGALISRLRQMHTRAPGSARPAAAQPAAGPRAAAATAAPAPQAGSSETPSTEPSLSSPADKAGDPRAGPAAPRPPPTPLGEASSRAGASAADAPPRPAAGDAPAAEAGSASAPQAPRQAPAPREAAAATPAREAPEAVAPGDEGAAAAPTAATKSPPAAPSSKPVDSYFDFDDLPDMSVPNEPVGSSEEKKTTEAKAAVASEEANPATATSQEESWDSKPMSELKRECLRRNIDLTGCFDKAEIILRLRGATTSAAVKPPGSKANLEADSSAAPLKKPAPVEKKPAPVEKQPGSNPDFGMPKTSTTPPVTPAATPSYSAAAPSSDKTTKSGDSPNADAKSSSGGPSLGGSATPAWSNCSVKELLKMAKEKGIDTSGCCEKKDIIERLERGPTKASTVTKARGDATRRAKSAAAPRAPSAAPKVPANGAPKAPSGSSWSSPSNTTEREAFPGWRSPAVSKPSSPAKSGTSANPKAGQAPRTVDDPLSSPSESLSWSSRVRRFFDCYPGFNAILPPEAETWTDSQLEVYFGTNGEIWPAGKRPSWMGRPSEEQKSEPQVPKKKQYPDLKEHFETLDLVETTPPDMIRRHYRRLARDHHPDKHPEDAEAAAERFRKIATAYEAIRERLRF